MAECLDEQAILGGIECIKNGMSDPLCQQNAHMLDWPICPSVPLVPPSCLSAEEVAGINYCHYGAGEEPFYDGMCWAYEKNADFWQRYINTPPCTGIDKPHAAPSDDPGGSGEPAKANMLYVGIGLAAVLGMGAFMFMKTKKQR